MTTSIPQPRRPSEGLRRSSGGSHRTPDRKPRRVMLAATPGGHIEELKALVPALGLAHADLQWVTSRSPQTVRMLEGQDVHWVDPIASSEIGKSMLALPRAMSLHRQVQPELLISTGAAMAAPHMLAAAAHRCHIWYIESATRLDGPSRTGAMALRLPRTRLFAQGQGWGDERWQNIADVFSTFDVQTAPTPARPVRKVVFTIGTERFPFARAVTRAKKVLAGYDVFWQIGTTPDDPALTKWVTLDALKEACAEADVVVTHGGIGSILLALKHGKVPVVIPRQKAFGEHIDDHQLEITRSLHERGLIVLATPDSLSKSHIAEAASKKVRARFPELTPLIMSA